MSAVSRVGLVAIVGRPNVGKSTLLNRLVGAKVSIVSRRPQTTRHRILGVVNRSDAQLIVVDTPGYQTEHSNRLNRLMNRTVTRSLQEVDAALALIEAGRLTAQDRKVIGLIPSSLPAVLAINKIDRLADREALLPLIGEASRLRPFAGIVPISAEKGSQLHELIDVLKSLLPEGQPLFGADALTDRPERFLAAELVREKLFESLGAELPYGATVVVDRFAEEGELRRIHAAIVVDKESQKAIVIGSKGDKLKVIATRARREMERLFGGKVYLEVWVRVKRGWADDARVLRSLGYE